MRPLGLTTQFSNLLYRVSQCSPLCNPTIECFVSKAADYTPQPKDLVVFRAPKAAISETGAPADTFFVKRIIARPGQQVQVTNGQVLINQLPLIEPYVQHPANYEWGPEIIPPETYFVLGDHRTQSSDSPYLGSLTPISHYR